MRVFFVTAADETLELTYTLNGVEEATATLPVLDSDDEGTGFVYAIAATETAEDMRTFAGLGVCNVNDLPDH